MPSTPPSDPDVSIIIPFYNCRDLTEACLRSLAETSTGVNWELILVDDASTEDLDLDWMPPEIRDRVTLLRNDSRCSFSENNNRAAEQATGKYLCLLNNDTLCTPGWLQALVDTAERIPDLGVLGNMHLYPDSDTVQHSGMGYDAQAHPFHLNPGASRYAPSVRYQRSFQSVTFACVLIPREVYTQLSGLDTDYRNGFEDCDFCLRARKAGHKVVYTPASRIVHYGQSTEGRTDTDDANWRLFQKRWADHVDRDLERLTKEDQHINTRRKAARINRGAEGLHFSIDLGTANAFLWATVDLISALERRNVPVSLPRQPIIDSSIPRQRRAQLKRLMSLKPRESYHVKWTHYWPRHMQEPLFGDVNAEFFCTNYRYRPDTIPDLWMRHVAVNEYRKLPVAGFNLDALGDIGVPQDQCSVMPLGYSPEIDSLFGAETPSRPDDREDVHILMVTNSHDLYRYGTDLAVRALAQAFGPEDPVVIHIKDYGASSGDTRLEKWIRDCERFPRVVWHRKFVSKPDLLKLYANMDLQLAPYRGEGFSMKILDAAALGVPTLMPAFGGPMEFSTPDTFFSLPYEEVTVGESYDRNHTYLGPGAYWCETSVDAIAESLQARVNNREECRKVGAAAMRHVRPAYSWDHAADCLMKALEGWSSDREVTVAPRRIPDETPLTVVIPTKDREDILDRTLNAYSRQTLPAKNFEILLVNDHGDLSAVQDVADRHAGVPIRLLDNPGRSGPAAARNFAIENARGGVVLITGDDIVPGPDFLKIHLDAHRTYPEDTAAFVGFTDWHPDLPQTPFMRHITGEGGQQFKYNDMRDGKIVPFDRLYTSNCSVKRAFLAEQEIMFSTRYRYAAYEDVELGYRLHLRGMKLRHLAGAIGYHHHEMTPDSFLRRQRLCGRMLTLLSLQRPGYVPNEHTLFLKALEFYRAHPGASGPWVQEVNPEALIRDLTAACRAMLKAPDALEKSGDSLLTARDAEAWGTWLQGGITPVWESVNQLIVRIGMLEEWEETESPDPVASAWLGLVLLPNIVSHQGMSWDMPYSRPEFTNQIMPNSKLVYRTAKILRGLPLIGPALHSFEHGPTGRYVRTWLAGKLSR